jgi:hypothetical protein
VICINLTHNEVFTNSHISTASMALSTNTVAERGGGKAHYFSVKTLGVCEGVLATGPDPDLGLPALATKRTISFVFRDYLGNNCCVRPISLSMYTKNVPWMSVQCLLQYNTKGQLSVCSDKSRPLAP